MPTLPEQIAAWCREQFTEAHAEAVADGLVDVAAGNREGTAWELDALDHIFADRPKV